MLILILSLAFCTVVAASYAAIPIVYEKAALAGSRREQKFSNTIEQLLPQAQAKKMGATEVHIVGGFHPKLQLDYYEDMMRVIKNAAVRMLAVAINGVLMLEARKAPTSNQIVKPSRKRTRITRAGKARLSDLEMNIVLEMEKIRYIQIRLRGFCKIVRTACKKWFRGFSNLIRLATT